MRRLPIEYWTAPLALAVLFGCSDDPELRVSSRPATASECPNGGLVFSVQNETYAPVCNGIDGPMGERGERGDTGARGATGVMGAAGVAGQDAQKVADTLSLIRPQNSSILLVQCTDGTDFVHGTGTKTTAGTVLTAEHVLEGMSSCELYSASPNILLGTMVTSAAKGQRDQTELQVAWTSGEGLQGLEPILRKTPELGDLVTIVGFPSVYDGVVREHQFTTGFVTSRSLSTTFENVPAFEDRDVEWESAWSTDAIIWHGNSGGPVFDAGGNWIGMAVGTFNGGADQEGPDISVVLPLF